MTTNAVNCEIFNDRLMAYLEYEVDDAARVALERHALSCDDCGALLADLRKLRVDAANLPELTPSRDLWAGIAARIEAPVVSIARPGAVATPARTRRWVNRAAIAASLVAAAGIGYAAAGSRPGAVVIAPPVANANDTLAPVLVATGDRVAEPAEASAAPAAVPASAPGAAPRPPVAEVRESGTSTAQLAVAALTADYDREVARLRRLIEERRNQLDPVTVAIIEKNLQVIDVAIAECQRAVARDPSSRFLIESLNQSLQSKVELMRTAALLPART